MAEATSDKHYEEKFEFPLWRLIKQRAEEKDISYIRASEEIVPEYIKIIRYRDTEFEDREIKKRVKAMDDLAEREKMENKL